VLGEGGFYVAPPDFLRNLRALCDRHGILLIADEIQSGIARTGRMFAIEHAGIEADLMTVAKSIAGGLPLSAVVGKAEIMDAPPPGGLGGTYAGSPLACAAALAVLDVITEERLIERAQQLGARLTARLKTLQAKYGAIGEVRGLGAMVAIELVKNGSAEQPDAELTRALVQAAARQGLIILSCGDLCKRDPLSGPADDQRCAAGGRARAAGCGAERSHARADRCRRERLTRLESEPDHRVSPEDAVST
jgi:4-aminobutyrate aminotransferase/(S)-3-amino-2-methylpropionate transaminase